MLAAQLLRVDVGLGFFDDADDLGFGKTRLSHGSSFRGQGPGISASKSGLLYGAPVRT